MDIDPGVREDEVRSGGDPCSRRHGLHVDRAPELVARLISAVTEVEVLPLARAVGRVLRDSVHASVNVPLFDHAAVDGYGLRSADAAYPESTFPVLADVRAGDTVRGRLERSAVRIMTGAPIPAGCDAVVKQEHARRHGGFVTITDAVRSGANIRRVGEDVSEGDLLVGAGTVLDTRHIALLAACGVAKVQTARRIRVAIAAFGNELQKPGSGLRPGHIFDANTSMATAFMTRPSCRIVKTSRAGDDRKRAAALLTDLATRADLIVTSGGMAAGDADYTRRALEDAGGSWERTAFDMKPGRPAGLGRIGAASVLGLPGNPFAALVALIVLGLPILARLTGAESAPKWLSATAAFELDRKPGHTEFFPARAVQSGSDAGLVIDRLGKGGSARLQPLVGADGLGRIEEHTGNVARGDKVLFLPFGSALT